MRGGKRLLELEVIRIFACLCILIIHFNAQVSGWSQFGRFEYPNHLIPNFYFDVYLGEIGVGLFFILSGAGLYNGYNFNILTMGSIKSFYVKRAKSLYPYFWVAYIFASFASFLWYKGMSMSKPIVIVTSILGIDGYMGMLFNRYSGFYQVGEWFLGCIIIIYLFYPFLSFSLNKAPIITCLAVVLLYFSFIGKWQYHWFFFQFPYILFGYFYMKWFRHRNSIELILGAFMLSLLRIAFGPSMHYYSKSIVTCIVLFILITSIYNALDAKYNITNSPKISIFIQKVAIMTYPAFLIHHKLITMMAPMFNLQVFPYRYTVMLFLVYISIVSYLAFNLYGFTNTIVKKITI
ncbi:MAG: acyltransferase family protein [Phascolarctobacterium sp.]|nr:acyltransferase family protein [Phascolarctobacterium sp.]